VPSAFGLLKSDALARVGSGAGNAIDRRKIWVTWNGRRNVFWLCCDAGPGIGFRHHPGRTLSDGCRSARSRYSEDDGRWGGSSHGYDATEKN